MCHFVGGQRLKRSVDHLFTIRQGEKETLRSYVKQFTRETLEVNEVDDKVLLTTFKAGLKSRDFFISLAKNPPRMMAEMLLKAQKYMNVEDALAVIKDVEKPGDKGRKEDDRRGQKRERPDRRMNDGGKRRDKKSPKTIKFTFLIMPIDKILAQIKDEHYLKWPRPLHSSPNVCDKKVLLVPQRSWPLYRGLQGLKRTDSGVDTERKIAEVCKEGGAQQGQG